MFNRREREESEKEGDEEGEQVAVRCVCVCVEELFEEGVITTCSFSTCANPERLVLEFFHIAFRRDRSAAVVEWSPSCFSSKGR